MLKSSIGLRGTAKLGNNSLWVCHLNLFHITVISTTVNVKTLIRPALGLLELEH